MFLMLMLACAGSTPDLKRPDVVAGTGATDPVTLTIYSGRGESMVGALWERLDPELGIALDVQYGSTPEMVTRMLTEGAESPADVIFAQDSGHLGALAARGMLEPLDEGLLAPVAPRYRGADGLWVGTSGRLRVLVYNTDTVQPDDLPDGLKGLADPRWAGKLGWAPGNGSFQAHVSALRHQWGDAETRAWLKGVQANAPKVYPKNSPQVEAAATGAIQVGWVNHYYLYRFDPETTPAANYSFRAPGDAGNVMMLAGVGVRKGTEKAAAARRFVSWMLSEEVQQYFAQETWEYPTRSGVPTHPDVPQIDAARLSAVPQSALADVGPTRVLLQELGLQ